MDLIRAKDVMGLPVVSIAVVRIVTDQGPIEADRLRALGAHALVVEEAKS